MNIAIAAFTHRGINLALKLGDVLGGEVFAPVRFSRDGVRPIDSPLAEWAGRYFHEAGALIFVCACGIAVRAVAPHIRGKMTDPAVISVDEAGRFVIPLLSGHVGGANDLARKIADFLHAIPIITTATDINGLPAIDEWAVKNDCAIENPEAVKHVSSRILEGCPVGVAITHEDIPALFAVTLMLRPRVLVLGAGCNRGVSPGEFESAAADFLKGAGVSPLSLKALASIDIKANEPAMKIFAARHNIPFMAFTADELNGLAGNFTASETVRRFTGTDNVCERSCMVCAGEGAVLLRNKAVYDGMTFALARSVLHQAE
ncbi:MAG: cobalt-precorrin 5A hydrolase [Synergistaceae bacterium]|nr:cobalt-precorrin 5A hydrolase [Synergistaceae bacterium]